jgi:hypothetical protein
MNLRVTNSLPGQNDCVQTTAVIRRSQEVYYGGVRFKDVISLHQFDLRLSMLEAESEQSGRRACVVPAGERGPPTTDGKAEICLAARQGVQ